ncbi:MAG: calcium-binding protein, partial [Candidatus Thiodiazotropha sp.]
GGDDILLGDAGDDVLNGGEGDDRLVGGAGNDELAGGEGDDILSTSAGTDILRGEAGNDVYLIGTGASENTIINQNETNEDAYDRIVFEDGVTPESVMLSCDGADLIIECGESLTRVRRYITNVNLYNQNQIDHLQFQDGTYWSYQDVLARLLEGDDTDQTLVGYESDDRIDGAGGNDSINGMVGDDQLFGGSGNDHIDGDNGNDQLTGGTGDDRLEGGQGNDTYFFQSGDGLDEIFDLNGNNRIEYLDLLSSQVDLNRSGDDLVITDLVGGGEITVLNQFGGINNSSEIIPIEAIQFSDGAVWDAEEILNQITNGGAGDDAIEGTSEADSIDVLDGNDDVFAHEGDDIVNGGTGDDYLFGETGNDLLIGGDGVDFVLGMEGDDYLDGGSGDDFLIASNTWPDRYELSDLREIFATDNYALEAWDHAWNLRATVAEYDILLGGEGDDLLIGAGELDGGIGNDRLLGSGVLYGGSGDDHLIACGVLDVGRNELYGMSLLDGGQGNDTLKGDGNTAYRFNLGDGQDRIHNNWNNSQYALTLQGRVIFGEGIEADSVNFERQGSDLLVRYGDQNDSVTITDWFVRVNAPGGYPHHNQFFFQLEQFEFADGSVITAEQAESGLTSDVGPYEDEPTQSEDPVTLVDDDGSHQFWGSSGDDDLSGEGGDDDINGLRGDDRLRGGSDDDRLAGGDGSDIYLYAPGDGFDIIDNRDDHGGHDVLRFDEGISPENISLTRDRNNLIVTISGNGVFYNGAVSIVSYFQDDGDNIYALDAIEFSDGTSWDYDYVAAHLTLGTEGDDELYGNLTGDELQGLAGDDAIYGSGGDDQLTGGSGNDRLYGQEGMDSLIGSEGDDWLYGGSANDTLQAGAGADRLVGGQGDDSLSGGSGDDCYLYSLGHGVDTIDNAGGGSDRIYFTDVDSSRLSYHQDGDDLLIVVDGDLAQSIRVTNHFLEGDAVIGLILTGEGSEISAEQISGLLTPLPEAPAADYGDQETPVTG